MDVRGIDFVGIAVGDMDAAKAFYGGTLGLPEIGGFSGNWAEFDAGNVTLALIKAEQGAIDQRVAVGPYAAIGVALAVPDVAQAVAALRAAGAPITMDRNEFPPCFIAMAQDPSGNHLWLHQRKDGTAC